MEPEDGKDHVHIAVAMALTPGRTSLTSINPVGDGGPLAWRRSGGRTEQGPRGGPWPHYWSDQREDRNQEQNVTSRQRRHEMRSTATRQS